MPVLDCTNGTLAAYVPGTDRPWDTPQLQHLFRRMGFGANLAELAASQTATPAQLVDQLLNNAINQPYLTRPYWADWAYPDYENYDDQELEFRLSIFSYFITQMLERGVREKMMMFWQNHFVTRYEIYYCPAYLYSYFNILERYAFGNFREFVREIGTTPAMLLFLNGLQNTRFSPNENYARELFELFTLGVNNGYTQTDITESARALTGYNGWTVFCGPIGFSEFMHDKEDKTIFGQTGNYDHDSLIDLLFVERGPQIARFICGKLYRFFVHPQEDADIVNGLADTLLANDFELAPMLRQLFKSERFFAEASQTVQVKSPYDMLMQFLREGGFKMETDLQIWAIWGTYNLGQILFDPIDVGGWPGNRSWIDANRLTGRWSMMDGFIYTVVDRDREHLRELARQLSGNSNDPEIITRAVADHFISSGLTSEEGYEEATDVFRWDVPQNYYDNRLWNLDWESAPWQLTLLLLHLVRQPEFQLN